MSKIVFGTNKQFGELNKNFKFYSADAHSKNGIYPYGNPEIDTNGKQYDIVDCYITTGGKRMKKMLLFWWLGTEEGTINGLICEPNVDRYWPTEYMVNFMDIEDI